MKYILKTHLFIMCIIIIIIIGCFLGYNISENFTELYISKLMLIPIRYFLLALVIIINFLVFNQQSGPVIVLRKKTLFNALISIFKIEVSILFVLFFVLHLPVLFLNMSQFINHLGLISKMIINCVIVSLVISSLIKIIDIKLKNRASACGLIFGGLCVMDFLLEHFNWYAVDEAVFDFSYIFVLPYIYNNYFFIALVLIATGLVLTALYVFFGIKKDCFLRSSYDKEN